MKLTQDRADAAFDAFQSLLNEIPSFQDTLSTEADVRFKVIDTILTSVLGWAKADVNVEERAGKGYLDYKLSFNEVARVVVEAKRSGRSFELAARECGHPYKIKGPILANPSFQKGLHQAIEYSAYKGTELACVTNGFEWVIFRSNRLGDGRDTLEGSAFVFGSLECIKTCFRIFYDLLAKERVMVLAFRGLFQQAEGRVIRHSSFERALRPPATANFLAQQDVIPELDRLMTLFFQKLSDENDRDMRELCFVETKESKAAEQRLLRLAEELVGHIRQLDTGSGAQLSDILDRARTSSLNQFILIVGTKGSGKSTFISRFFNKNLPANLRGVCVPIFIDLAESDGDEETIVSWARKKLLEKAELALGGQTPTWDELIGHMFFSEYQRWSTSTMRHLYLSNRDEFKVQFGKHVEFIRRDEPLEYVSGLLRNFIKGRKQLPCLIFDNADHFSIGFQERVFQFARSLFEQQLSIVIMPITDKTSWQLANQGAFTSFDSEALLLPTPPAKVVLEKRINFVLKKIEEGESHERGTYFVGKGIRVDVADLLKFVRGLQEVFLNSETTAYILGQLANHNVRYVLEISRNVINSPHIGLNEAFKAYVLGNAIYIQDFKIRKALIRGRYDVFVPGKFVHNMFALNAEIETSPLIGVRILQALKDSQVHFGETNTRYLAKTDLYGYMLAMGFAPAVMALWLDALLKASLVINYDPTCITEETATQLEISPAGEQHLFWAKGNYDYIEAMAEATAVLSEEAYSEMLSASHLQGQSRMHQMIKAFVAYLKSEDLLFCTVPEHESFFAQQHLFRAVDQS